MKNSTGGFTNKIKWSLYSLKIKIFKPLRKHKKSMSIKTKDSIFLFFFLLFPMAQFIIFYIVLNANSLLMAFKKYDFFGSSVSCGFENFKEIVYLIFKDGYEGEFLNHYQMVRMIKNSAIQMGLSLGIMLPINVVSAYVIFKKVPFSNFLKVILFLPNLIPCMVFVINAKLFINRGLPSFIPGLDLLNQAKTSSFWTVLVFGAWMTFASGLIIYLSAMASIPQDVLEYGQLEPLSSFKELVYIVIPLIFPTIVTYVVVGIANFFINAGYFFAFYSGSIYPTIYDNLGYYFFVQVASNNEFLGKTRFGFAAAGGILFTFVVAPITFIVKFLLEKFGPSEE